MLNILIGMAAAIICIVIGYALGKGTNNEID